MKSIKDLLPEKTVDTLIQICRTYNLKNYAALRKDELINLISQNLNKPQFKEKVQSLIPNNGTTALILKSFIDNKNEISYSNLRREVLKKRADPTFRHYYQELMKNFILFMNESSEDDTLFLPKEFINFAENVLEDQEGKILPPIQPKIPKLKKQIKKLLEELSLFISKIKGQETLEMAVIQGIQQSIDHEESFKDIKIKEAGKNSPTILVERPRKIIGISVCYIRKNPKGEIDKIKIKLFDYLETYGNNLIFYIYDSTGKVNTAEIEKLQKYAEVIFRQRKHFTSSN